MESKNRTPLITVTVPVYNSESTLARCLDSILRQSFNDFEVIVVNDGSTDNSGQICENFAKKDSRVSVIQKSNGGSASARLAALAIARGKYYTVCDSDDWMDIDTLKDLYQTAEKNGVDLVISDFFIDYSDGKQKKVTHLYCPENVKDVLIKVLGGDIACASWNKLFLMSIIRTIDKPYVEGINLGEDKLFLLKYLQKAKSVSYVPKAYYHYGRNVDSTSYTTLLKVQSYRQLKKINEWEHEIFNNYPRELLKSDLNLVFCALRADSVQFEEVSEVMARITICNLLKFGIYSLKGMLTIMAKINYPLTKWLVMQTHKHIYK